MGNAEYMGSLWSTTDKNRRSIFIAIGAQITIKI